MSDAIDIGEMLSRVRTGDVASSGSPTPQCHVHRLTCVMCSGTKTVIALELMPDKPVLCHRCYRQVVPQYPALPIQVVGRYMSGPSFMDDYVDKVQNSQ